MLIAAPLFLILVGFPILGFLMPPPRTRLAGAFFWITLSLILVVLLFVGIGTTVSMVHDYRRHGGLAWWEPVPPFVCLAFLCALLANTFWVFGKAKALPPDIEEEQRREALRGLSRRLWLPLCLFSMLAVITIPLGLMPVRMAASPPGPKVAKTSPVAPLPRLSIGKVARLPDGCVQIHTYYHVEGGPYERGILSLEHVRFEEEGSRKSCDCRLLYPSSPLQGPIPADIYVAVAVTPSSGALQGTLSFDTDLDASPGAGGQHSIDHVEGKVSLP